MRVYDSLPSLAKTGLCNCVLRNMRWIMYKLFVIMLTTKNIAKILPDFIIIHGGPTFMELLFCRR